MKLNGTLKLHLRKFKIHSVTTILMGLFNFLTQEIAIDLGTANTLIIHGDKVVVDQPSIVAKNRLTGQIIAVGKKSHANAWENS